jgi:putative transposase
VAPHRRLYHRYSVEILSHCVCLYHRFPLSVREVEEMRTGRGVMVFYETIRAPNQLCRRWPRPGDQWHQDEVSIKMGVR